MPLDVTAISLKSKLATSHVVTLQVIGTDEQVFTPDSDMEPVAAEAAHVSSDVVRGNLVSKVQPVYPAAAKQRRSAGTVILQAVIARDGSIHSLHIVSTPDPDLAIAAIAAVRQWRYTPYKLNGLPTDVSTTISVNFDIRRGP